MILLYQMCFLIWYFNENESNIKDRDYFFTAINSEFEQISRQLEPFVLKLPNFFDKNSQDWFSNSTFYKRYSSQCFDNDCEKNGFYFNDPKEHLNVSVTLVQNGVYYDDSCGYNYDEKALRRTFVSENHVSAVYEQVIIYTVPDGWSFQHFLDGIGPKLAISRKYLDQYPDSKVLIIKGPRFDRSVQEIWNFLGVNQSKRIIHYNRRMKIGAKLLINPCRTPGIHPFLWYNARSMYWSLINLQKFQSNLLIYVQRTSENAKNGGRLIQNENLVIDYLHEYAQKSSLIYIEYDHSKHNENIQKQIELFSNAQIIFGIHGGALSNINFASSKTIIIEIMPYRSDKSSLPIVCSKSDPNRFTPCGGYSYYVQANLLNQSYWILPSVVDQQNNVNVNMTKLRLLFNSLTISH
ncbi:unnamed protein product [Adineta ricciae]|uniref:Glycosyltransferase 61 catalytic domain-containing protein n=1 Tax=Adineta ricciae TaxID=249248 RepID=A0A815HVS3_ADIRI|nr:unnamed protein product [Adineta ricciae]CAF1357934.1 unnamed protein product [Adineta ricciae]